MRGEQLGVSLAFMLALCPACSAARRTSPLLQERPVTDPVVRNGQTVFHRECNPCHPGGTGGLGPAINDKPLPAIERQVRQGFGEMPAFSQDEISEQELRALVQYLEWLRERGPRIGEVD